MAKEHLRALATKGAIIIKAGSARGIRLMEQLCFPLIGSVAAGGGKSAGHNKNCALTVITPRGLSASNPGQHYDWRCVLDGDLLAIHNSGDPRSGQIVVARLGNEVTVKRLKRRDERIKLLNENPDYAPIVVINSPMNRWTCF